MQFNSAIRFVFVGVLAFNLAGHTACAQSVRGPATDIAAVAAPSAASAIAGGPFQPTADSLKQYRCPEWFRNAKFGIWSHWGPDSIPGLGNNYAHDLWRQGGSEYQWHLEHYGHPSKFGYKDVIESWKAEKFDPDALVAKYKAAGAKYIVALATHHDNFDELLGSHEKIQYQQGPKSLTIQPVKEWPCRHAVVFKIK